MISLIIFVILICIGIIDSSYLIYKFYKKHPLVCPMNTDCNAVLNSKWGKFLGVRNEIWGLFYYLLLLAFVLIGNFYITNPLFSSLVIAYTYFGLLYSLYLTYIQIYKIKEYCLYCLLSALVNLLLVFNSLFL